MPRPIPSPRPPTRWRQEGREVSLAPAAGIGRLGEALLFIFHHDHFVRVGRGNKPTLFFFINFQGDFPCSSVRIAQAHTHPPRYSSPQPRRGVKPGAGEGRAGCSTILCSRRRSPPQTLPVPLPVLAPISGVPSALAGWGPRLKRGWRAGGGRCPSLSLPSARPAQPRVFGAVSQRGRTNPGAAGINNRIALHREGRGERDPGERWVRLAQGRPHHRPFAPFYSFTCLCISAPRGSLPPVSSPLSGSDRPPPALLRGGGGG